MSSERRLSEMGIDPDGDPGEIMREVTRRYYAVRAKYDENGDLRPEAAVEPVIVDTTPKPCDGSDAACEPVKRAENPRGNG